MSNDSDIPLLSYYTRDTVNTSPVTIRVLGKTPDMDIAHTFEAGYDTKFPILGLYPDYLNTVEITDNGQTIVRHIQTEAISGIEAPEATVLVDYLPEADPFNQDLYWALFINSWRVVAYDRKGDIRYYFVPNGNHLARIFDEDGEMKIQSSYNIKSFTGNTLFTANTLYDYHHDSIRLNNGRYVNLSNSDWGDEDRVIEQTSSGIIVNNRLLGSLFRDVIDDEDISELNKVIYDDVNPYINSSGDKTQKDWAHANSLVYDEDTDIMYFSLKRQGVIAVKYSEWKLIWWMVDDDLATTVSAVGNFMQVPSLDKYRVKGDAENDGPDAQHALFLHANGNLGMFDNAGEASEANPLGSRYVEYKITGDIGSFIATKVREYRDASLYSRYMSDIDFTGEGNLLIVWALMRKIREVDLNNGNQVLFDISISTSLSATGCYRVDKMPLYPYQDPDKKYSMDYNEKEGK